MKKERKEVRKTIRLTDSLLSDIEKVGKNKGLKFSATVVYLLEEALGNVRQNKNSSGKCQTKKQSVQSLVKECQTKKTDKKKSTLLKKFKHYIESKGKKWSDYKPKFDNMTFDQLQELELEFANR